MQVKQSHRIENQIFKKLRKKGEEKDNLENSEATTHTKWIPITNR